MIAKDNERDNISSLRFWLQWATSPAPPCYRWQDTSEEYMWRNLRSTEHSFYYPSIHMRLSDIPALGSYFGKLLFNETRFRYSPWWWSKIFKQLKFWRKVIWGRRILCMFIYLVWSPLVANSTYSNLLWLLLFIAICWIFSEELCKYMWDPTPV